MGQRTEEQLTTDIEGTRRDLAADLDALNERVNPQRMVERRKQAARGSMSRMRDRVMGTSQDARHRVGSAGDSVTDSASSAAQTIESRTEGNPLAAGLIAFGAGWLVSSIIPASEREAQAAQRVVDTAKEHGQPVMDEAKSVGQEMGQELKEHASQAAQEVKGTAEGSAQHVKDEGSTSAQHVKDDAQNRM